jgi:hypothetical protein
VKVLGILGIALMLVFLVMPVSWIVGWTEKACRTVFDKRE